MIRHSSAILACVMLSACGQSGNDTSQGTDGAASSATGAPATPTLVAGAPPPAFAVCSSCHAVAPGAHGVGPSLAGVWGRKAGSLPDYAYSDALKASGIVWKAQTLDSWLAGPMKMVPGTRMVIGVPDAAGRQAVIAYLETLK